MCSVSELLIYKNYMHTLLSMDVHHWFKIIYNLQKKFLLKQAVLHHKREELCVDVKESSNGYMCADVCMYMCLHACAGTSGVFQIHPVAWTLKGFKKRKKKMNASAVSSALIEFLSIAFTDFKRSPHNYLFS